MLIVMMAMIVGSVSNVSNVGNVCSDPDYGSYATRPSRCWVLGFEILKKRGDRGGDHEGVHQGDENLSPELSPELAQLAQLASTVCWAHEVARIDALLVAALARVESGFDPEIVSHKGAVGLLQIMPETALKISAKYNLGLPLELLSNPVVSVHLGVLYLRELLLEFERMDHALTAYHRGPRATRYILKHNKGVLPDEIYSVYARKVLIAYGHYLGQYGGLLP